MKTCDVCHLELKDNEKWVEFLDQPNHRHSLNSCHFLCFTIDIFRLTNWYLVKYHGWGKLDDLIQKVGFAFYVGYDCGENVVVRKGHANITYSVKDFIERYDRDIIYDWYGAVNSYHICKYDGKEYEEYSIGDGVDFVFGEDCNAISPDTEEFNKAMEQINWENIWKEVYETID